MYGYIYKTTNLINGKIYIGKKTSEVFLPWYKGSGRALGEAFAKYGWDNFSVEFLCPCFSLKELNAEERFLIKYFDCRVKHGKGYNISEGGDWGDISEGMSQEDYERWCRNLSEACSGERNGFYGKKHTEESKKLISKHHADFSGENHPMYGKHPSQATRKKMSESMKGRIPWNKGLTKEDSRVARYVNAPRKNLEYHLKCKTCGREYVGRSPSQKCPYCLNKAPNGSK